MTVSLCTHCHARDLPRLHAPGVLDELINSHDYPFDEIIIIHQRCGDMTFHYPFYHKWIKIVSIEKEDYPNILSKFGMNPNDTRLDEITHGWSWQWYWQHHCVNHLTEILESKSDFIIFNDADCRIKNQSSSWVVKAIELLNNHPEIFMVSPSDGGHDFIRKLDDGTRLLQMTSQQLFMLRSTDAKNLDFTNLQWDGKFIDGGPFQEWYGLFEGWLYRWMIAHNLYRAILPEQWRYWHSEWH